MKIWIVAVLVVIVVTGVACSAGEPPAETPAPTESPTPTAPVSTATPTPPLTPTPTATPTPTPTAMPTPTLTPTATREPSRGEYCLRLNTARESLREAETYSTPEFNALASEILFENEARAWEKLDNDPARQDLIASELARNIRLARRIIDLDPHPSLDFLHYEVATAADSYIEAAEVIEIATSRGERLSREVARNFFISAYRGQIAAFRALDNPRCPY